MIRESKIEDLDQIKNIEDECFLNFAWSKKMIEEHLENHKGYIYEIQDQIISFLMILDLENEIEILRIGTNYNFQRKGYAEKLIIHLIENNSSQKLFLEVSEDNRPAINLYTKIGFKIIGERKKYYQDGSSAICMSIGELS